MTQAQPDQVSKPEKKRLLGPRMRYALFMLAWIALIALAFNAFFTFKFHKEFVTRDLNWPGCREHPVIGYENIPAFEADWETYYFKSHELGYRIGRGDDPKEIVPGGILAIGGSFTFGDAVEHHEAFAGVAGEALGLPVYNYGVGSYSYASVLLQLRDLEQRGVLEKLQPSIILLGAGDWLVDRSLSPLFPTEGLPFGYAFIGRSGEGLEVKPPPSFYAMDHLWDLVDRYYPEGTDENDTSMTASRFMAMFSQTPRVLAARAAGKFRYRPGHSDIPSEELYRFIFSEIESVADQYDARFAVLWMPLFRMELDLGLSRSLNPRHVLVDGAAAIREHKLGQEEFAGRHPSAPAHAAYGARVAAEIEQARAAAVDREP